MDPIFHIGYPKTATRWLQESVFPFIKNARIIPKEDIFKNIINPDGLAFEPEEIKNKFELNDNETTIFSTHELLGTNYHFGIHGYLIKENALRIKKLFPNSRIIIFIRNQVDIITSAYLQYIVEGGTYCIKKYLNNRRLEGICAYPLFTPSFFEFHRTIGFYKQLFGKERVYVFLFEDLVANPEYFLRNFSKILGLDIDYDKISYEVVNPSIRRLLKYLIQFFNHFTEMKMLNKHYFFHVPWLYEILKVIYKNFNNYKVFGKNMDACEVMNKNTRKKLEQLYTESNSILMEDLDVNIKQYGYSLNK